MKHASSLLLASCVVLFACLGASLANGQTNIFGVDNRNGELYRTNVVSFVASYSVVGAQPTMFPCVDFDASATTFWAANSLNFSYGIIDTWTGAYTNVGTIVGPTKSLQGWTADAKGTDWWLTEYDASAGSSQLWRGDVATGIFTLVGTIGPILILDIAIDSYGALYGYGATDDALYLIDTGTGSGAFVGLTGLVSGASAGMDFDWTYDFLYATLDTGGGTGVFCQLSTTTGSALVLEDTTALNADLEMACRSVVPVPGIPYCFCNPGNPTGNAAPCGNYNDGSDPFGAGCAHAEAPWGPQGARLHGTGRAMLSSDSVTLHGLRGPLVNSTIFFQANNNRDGLGIYLGDGIRCAGGGLIRLKAKATDASGYADSAPARISSRSAAFGHTIQPGETLYYQWWFRDPNPSPCGNENNTSNGYRITWLP